MQQVSGQQEFEVWFSCSDQTPCPDPIEEKIRSFANLQKGWNYGEGRAPSHAVIKKALKIYKHGKKLGLDAEVFPIVNGDIEISLYAGDHFMDILAHRNGQLEFFYERGVGEKYDKVAHRENISIGEVKQHLSELPKLCDASESLVTTTISLNADLLPAASSTTMGGFQLLIGNALLSVTIPQFANTLLFSIVPAG